jgi:rubrerythrin
MPTATKAPDSRVYSWLPAIEWRCPQCGAVQTTNEAAPRCSVCGHRQDE